MKRTLLLSLILTLALLLSGCSLGQLSSTPAPISAPTAEPAPASVPSSTPVPTPTPKPVSPEVQAMMEKNESVWKEMHNREYMEGRLVIPSAGIDVALISSGESGEERQAVVDKEDSALLYYDDRVGNIIADHSNQDFGTLSTVKIGDAAYILQGDRMVSLRCGFVSDGVNTGFGITDMDGGWNHPDTDYVCYTCLEDWTHIQIVGFTVTDEDFFQMAWIDVGETDKPGAVAVSSGVTTSSGVPAATEAPAATAAPASAAPSPTPTPTAQPQAQARPVQQAEPDYYTIPGYDIYANDSNDYYPSYSSGDGYLY